LFRLSGPALALEFVDGEDLAQRIAQGPVPIDEALAIAKQIADALEAAHEQGIIHRDLKPANIKVRADGTVKVLDFGLAKAVDPPGASSASAMNSPTLSVHATQGGLILGTAAYMSPEQAAGKPTDKRSDLWSFGVVVMEMITGAQVFTGETVTHVLASVLKTDPDWTSLPQNTPVPLRRLLHRCLEKNRKLRLADAADARLEIEDAERAPATVESPSQLPATPRPSRSRQLVMWTWAAVTIALAAALALRWSPRGDDPATGVAPLKFIPLSFEQGGQTRAVWSPDGKAVAYGARQQTTDPYQLYVRYLDSPIAMQITRLTTSVMPVEWTTGGRIVFGTTMSGGAQLWTVSPVGGEPESLQKVNAVTSTALTRDGRTLAWLHPDANGVYGISINSPPGSPGKPYPAAGFTIASVFNAPALRFSPDGRQILYFRNGGGGEQGWLLPYPADAARPPRRVFETLPTFGGTPQFSWMPDSRHVVVSSATGDEPDKLWMADTATGTFTPLSSGTTPQRHPVVSPDGTRLALLEQDLDFDLMSLDLATAQSTPLLATRRGESMAAWAAAEAALVYATDRNGGSEIWLRKPGQPDRPLVTARDFPLDTTQWFMGPVLSPDGTRVIYTRNGKSDGRARLWMSSVAGGPPVRVVKGGEDTEFAGSWSPDGRWFVYWGSHEGVSSLKKVKTTGEAPPEDVKAKVDRVGQTWVPVWSPKGEWILHADSGGARLIAPDGKSERTLRTGSGYVYAFSRDGRTVYGISRPAAGTPATVRPELFSMSVDGGAEKVIGPIAVGMAPTNPLSPSQRLTFAPDGKSFTYTIAKPSQNLWLAEGLATPSRKR
jgi:Tol biopolymer transport system component